MQSLSDGATNTRLKPQRELGGRKCLLCVLVVRVRSYATQTLHSHSPSEEVRQAQNSKLPLLTGNSVLSGPNIVLFLNLVFWSVSQQHYVYYDMWWACQHTLFVWLSSLLMLMMFMLPLCYCDALHKCALHLGGWERYPCGHRDTPHV